MENARKFGPVQLAHGVEPRHVWAFLFAAFVSIGLFTYLVALTPYILRANLGIAEGEMGTVTGTLGSVQEIVILLVIGWWGVLSDRIGRRKVYIAGFAILSAAYLLYGFANSIWMVAVIRLIFALGLAATTTCLATVLADYPNEKSRGKLTGIAFMLNGIGAVIFFVGLTKLPDIFVNSGSSEIWAGRYAMMIAAAIALTATGVMFGLKPGRPEGVEPRTPLLKLMREGLEAARNPRIAVSYASAFTARADLAIVTLFLTLWVMQSGTAQGLSLAEATMRAGMVVGISQTAALVWAPIYGWIGDHLDRLTVLALGFLLAVLGYGWVGLLGDPGAYSAIPAMIVLGIGLSSAQLGSTVLLAQEAPKERRGSIIGLQSLCGGLGIMTLSYGGGRLFDAMGPNTPFIAITIANAVVLAIAVAVRLYELRARAAAQPASE